MPISDTLITDYDHVNVVAPAALELETITFYRDVLRLEQLPKPEANARGGAWFAVGSLQLHVGREEGSDQVSHASHRHFCMRAPNLSAVKQQLAAHNVMLAPDRRPLPGINRIFFRDPAGNLIEIQEAP